MDPTLFITPFGRLTRPGFAWAVALVLSVFVLAMNRLPGAWLAHGAWLAYLPLYWALFCLLARRLQDSDRSRAWVLLLVVPVLGPLVLLGLLGCPGTVGPNRFGRDPYALHLLRRKGAA